MAKDGHVSSGSTSARRVAASKRTTSVKWTEYLSEQLLEIDRRLDNWARWAYERLGGPRHCGSVEHKYVPGRDDERGETLQRECAEPIDAIEAQFVEQCVTMLRPQSRVRAFLRSYYLGRHHWRQTCRVLRIHPDLFPAAHIRTLAVVGGVIHAAREGASNAQSSRGIVPAQAPPITARNDSQDGSR